MTPGPVELLISRDDFRSFEVRDAVTPVISAGQAVLRIERFSLTSNNLTYALAGNMMGYWDFFPGVERWGRLPVWGFADVEQSECPELGEGDRVFGVFPAAGHVVLRPARSVEWGLIDSAPHRANLPPVYSAYFKTDSDPLYDAAREDQLALLRILFMTAYLIEQYLVHLAGPRLEVAVLSSASSKTALALAHLLKLRGDRVVIGLTSASNRQFVESCGVYDDVLVYEDVAELDGVNVAYIDFAGNGELRERVHSRLGPSLERSVAVGAAHWQRVSADRVQLARDASGAGPEGSFAFAPSALLGPRPELFFAGDHLAKQMDDRGVSQFWEEFARAWKEFVVWTDRWLRVEHISGGAALAAAYEDLLSGTADPATGVVITPWAPPL